MLKCNLHNRKIPKNFPRLTNFFLSTFYLLTKLNDKSSKKYNAGILRNINKNIKYWEKYLKYSIENKKHHPK